jgi:HK97 gp10 family phage protein
MATWKSTIPQIRRELDLRAETASKNAAERVVQGAKLRSRVRSGTMRGGWQFERTGRHEYTVDNPVDWTIYNEFGTRYMSAQPMLGPAMEEEAHSNAMIDEVQKAFDNGLGAGH